MPKDNNSNNNNTTTNSFLKKYAKAVDDKRKRKTNSFSDDDANSNDDDNDNDNVSYCSDDDEAFKDKLEYQKLLHDIFPSKYMKNKIKSLKKQSPSKNKGKDKDKSYSSSSSSSSSCNDSSCESDDDEIVEFKGKGKGTGKGKGKDIVAAAVAAAATSDKKGKGKGKGKDKGNTNDQTYNIVFTIGSDEFYDDDEDGWETCSDDYEYYDDDDVTENEDDPISSSEEEDSDTLDTDEDEDEDENPPKKRAKKELTKDTTTASATTTPDANITLATLNQLKHMLSKSPNDKHLNKCVKLYQQTYQKQVEKQERKLQKMKDRNGRIFRRILKDKNTLNDFDFYEKLEVEEQKKIIKELREINKLIRVEKPYRLSLIEADIPIAFKAAAMKKINTLKYMSQDVGEYYKMKNWVDAFMRIPFGKYQSFSLSIEDGVDSCHDFMENAQKTLNDAVYGLNDAKMQIMQMLGQLITNPNAIGSAIAIHGPPGTGKTSLIKEGVSKILNRPFAFIALGGATDNSFLEGHGYTYEGSTWGKIVQILIDSKCMNPVIYFDELDKISDTPKGEEIVGILTHLTDTSQNTQFHDKYFSEIDFDLSKCLFIFSYNDESKINPILKDRMYRIQTKGYDLNQKLIIANNYLLPKIREQVRFNEDDIVIPKQTIDYLVSTYCNGEDGVRNLKRCLEIIHTKLNLYRLMKEGINLFEEDMSLKVSFPFTVTKEVATKLIKKPEHVLPQHVLNMFI